MCESGITPARAGKTIQFRLPYVNHQDHPRSRGKDFKNLATGSELRGSPPLARERPGVKRRVPTLYGITPARAGKTLS